MKPLDRLLAAAMALALGTGPACERAPRDLTPEELAAIKAEVKEELRRELAAERAAGAADAHALPPPALTAAERTAIAEARARTHAAAPPIVEPRIAPATPPPPGPDANARIDDDRAAPPPEPVPGPDDDDPELAPQPSPRPADPEDAAEREAGPAREVRPGMLVYPAAGTLRLTDLAVGTTISDREPRDVRKVYDRMPELFFCYTVVDNAGEEQTVTHVWRRGTRLVSRVELNIGPSPKWRTWSRQRTRADWTGPWSCEVLAPDGHRLGIASFEVRGG